MQVPDGGRSRVLRARGVHYPAERRINVGTPSRSQLLQWVSQVLGAPATVGAVESNATGSHPYGQNSKNQAICQAQEQGEIEEQDEEARAEIGCPIEEGRDHGEEESRQARSGNETKEAASGPQGHDETQDDSETQSRSNGCAGPDPDAGPDSRHEFDSRTRTGTGGQSGAGTSSGILCDDRKRRDGPADGHGRMNDSAPTGLPIR